MEGNIRINKTPFERALESRAKSQLVMATHIAVSEIVHQLNECESMIAQWQETAELYNQKKATKEELEADLILATQALKDQKTFEAALIVICERASADLGLEA